MPAGHVSVALGPADLFISDYPELLHMQQVNKAIESGCKYCYSIHFNLLKIQFSASSSVGLITTTRRKNVTNSQYIRADLKFLFTPFDFSCPKVQFDGKNDRNLRSQQVTGMKFLGEQYNRAVFFGNQSDSNSIIQGGMCS